VRVCVKFMTDNLLMAELIPTSTVNFVIMLFIYEHKADVYTVEYVCNAAIMQVVTLFVCLVRASHIRCQMVLQTILTVTSVGHRHVSLALTCIAYFW